MSGPSQIAGKKRKAYDGVIKTSADARKRNKRFEAFNIATETADAALSRTGELNIASFVKNREFEINALEKSMRKARKVLTSRAFQQLPRHLRRRTASHNVKKVPRRLRRRAIREMKEDNTPTVTSKSKNPSTKLRLRLENAKALRQLTAQRKLARRGRKEAKVNAGESDPAKQIAIVRLPRVKKNKLAQAPRATTKYKRRQVNKTWLPTHMWHTKRARMTRPVKPLWRMAIALSPTEKCYRSSHRASESRGCVAWDMSYMSTIGCLGTDHALEGMLKAVGFSGHSWSGLRYKSWKSGSRFATSWTCEHEKHEAAIAPVEVIWSSPSSKTREERQTVCEQNEDAGTTNMKQDVKRKHTRLDHRLFIRVHPSAFAQIWAELLKVAKLQKPQVLLEDLRFEIGAIDVTGPGSTEALVGVLNSLQQDDSVGRTWSGLASLSNPALLPSNALLAFEISDPRLHHPPKQVKVERSEASLSTLNELMVDWPLDKTPPQPTLFSHKARHLASRLPSQKAINRRKASVVPGQPILATEQHDHIPVVLLAQRPQITMSSAQGTWTVLAPWGCVDPIWRSLVYYPLTSGGIPRFGGLDEKRQVAFEQAVPWFPADYPGSMAGQAWERTESEKRFDEWVRKPPSRRLAFDRVDLGLDRRGELGRGWACDWEFLFQALINTSRDTNMRAPNPSQIDELLLTQRQRKAAKAKATMRMAKDNRRRNSSSPESDANERDSLSDIISTFTYTQLLPSTAALLLKNNSRKQLPTQPCLVTVKITLLTRGTPSSAARIYRLPKSVPETPPTNPTEERLPVSHPVSIPHNVVPPSAQASPPTLPSTVSTAATTTSPHSSQDLRSRWLALDMSAGMNKTHMGKIRTNRHQLPREQSHLPVTSLRHINVLPKNAPAEVVEQYGPKPLTQAEQQAQLDELLNVKMEEEKVWEVHVPCPDQGDLVGFVTSGGYNLSQGKGTAIGGLWMQRLLDGWQEKGVEEEVDKRRMKQRDRERHLCVVRNVGESIGRLAIWELCL